MANKNPEFPIPESLRRAAEFTAPAKRAASKYASLRSASSTSPVEPISARMKAKIEAGRIEEAIRDIFSSTPSVATRTRRT